VNTVLWHKPNDPSLGYINAGQAQPTAGGGGASATVTPQPTQTPAPTATPTATTSPTSTASSGVTSSGSSSSASGGTGTGTSSAASGGSEGALTTSPVLSSGPAGGSTTYTPPCNYLSVPANVGASITTVRFLSLFQPVGNILSAWRFNNATH